jgi:hypothetical protein
MEAGHGGWRTGPTGTVQQRRGFHDVLLWTGNMYPLIVSRIGTREEIATRAPLPSRVAAGPARPNTAVDKSNRVMQHQGACAAVANPHSGRVTG